MFDNNIIIQKEHNGTEYIQFKRLLEFPNLKHCYTLRKNGINIQVKNRDSRQLIESYKKVGEALNIDWKTIVKPHQTHTDRVEMVEDANKEFSEVDGLLTNKNNIMLCTTSADCTSLIMYDDNKKVVGDIHSGWRGTAKKIAKKAVQKMIDEYGSNPKDIICAICPCIRKCHFEVEEDVKEIFRREFEYTRRLSEIIQTGRVVDGVQKYNIDTVLINKIILEEAGVRRENILDSGICTVCNSKEFHSHRVDRENSGRNGAFVGLIN